MRVISVDSTVRVGAYLRVCSVLMLMGMLTMVRTMWLALMSSACAPGSGSLWVPDSRTKSKVVTTEKLVVTIWLLLWSLHITSSSYSPRSHGHIPKSSRLHASFVLYIIRSLRCICRTRLYHPAPMAASRQSSKLRCAITSYRPHM